MRVVFFGLPHHKPAVEARLRRVQGIDLAVVTEDADAITEAASADVLVITPNRYTPGVEEAVVSAGRLRLVQLLSAGFDTLINRRLPPEAMLATAGDSLAPAVAEHALALTLALVRRLDAAFLNQTGQKWDRGPFAGLGTLEGKRAAVVGFGAIGKAIALRLAAFGVHVTGVSRSGRPDPAADQMEAIAYLDEVLARSDLVLIALPGSPETENLFNRERLGAAKRGAILVNIARGRIVDTLALADALNAGRIGAAGLDVTEPEPLLPGHPLWKAANVIITPHYGGIGGQQRVAEFVAGNLERLRDGIPLMAVVVGNVVRASQA
jgi:phosphoglycerate dehydrogenase-like enzyme